MSRRKRKGKGRGRGRGITSSKKPDLSKIMKRVKKVGPEHFGILAIDPAKTLCAYHITNFYGEILMPPTDFGKNKRELNELINMVKKVMAEHQLDDLTVALEMSGSYYKAIKRVLKPHWTVDMIHPFTTKQLRQPASHGVKTDPVDLMAITRGVISGYSFTEAELPPFYDEWRLCSRFRRDLINKRTSHKLQCVERIDAVMPGYTSVFDSFWDCPGAVFLARTFGSAKRILECGFDGIRECLRKEKVIMARTGIHKVLEWARNAPEPAPHSKTRRRIIRDELEIINRLTKKITEYEYDLLKFLVKNPALVMLSLQGLNVVAISEYACELGPVCNYFNPARITGRAGIFPSRFQSSTSDYPDGPLVRGHNTRLRAAIMNAANCLKSRNSFFQGWVSLKKQRDKKRRRQKGEEEDFIVSIAYKFTRISFNMLAAHQVFDHPQGGRGEPILLKIIDFCKRKKINLEETDKIIRIATENLPQKELLMEAQAIEKTIKKSSRGAYKIFYDHSRRQQMVDYLWSKIEQNTKEKEHDIKNN